MPVKSPISRPDKKFVNVNRIYHGDNLYYMPDMPSESIDLIYIDPLSELNPSGKVKPSKRMFKNSSFMIFSGGG